MLEIVIDRASKRNAMTNEMYEQMAEAFNETNAEGGASVVLVRAEGEYFCAGQDVRQLANVVTSLPIQERSVFRFMRSIFHCERPIIAAVEGPAVGIGATMLLHFDLVYMADHAWLSFPFSTLGLSPEFGASALLPQLAGRATAARALLLGEKVSTKELVSTGLVVGSGSSTETSRVAKAAAVRLASMSASAVRATRRLIGEASAAISENLLIRELEVLESLRSTPEHQSAMDAWRQQ
ncbi:enoyl-CoA hydratase-related protein [Paraburkholderia sp. MM5482-R1]|uniref:enoyl-CoA hydratase-related protein n=1 Tax=unclassified Paraburkholderia TaxID=2615204 RepID=UPI003D1AA42D